MPLQVTLPRKRLIAILILTHERPNMDVVARTDMIVIVDELSVM